VPDCMVLARRRTMRRVAETETDNYGMR
jgi:hypothetical protein